MSWKDAIDEIFGMFTHWGPFRELNLNQQQRISMLLVQSVAPHACAIFRGKGLTSEAAEDLASEVVSKFLYSRTVHSAQQPRAYYFTMLNNALVSHYRARVRRPTLIGNVDDDDEMDDEVILNEPNDEDTELTVSTRQALERFSRRRPDDYALLSLYALGTSIRELAAQRGNVAIDSVTPRLENSTRRAIADAATRLREFLRNPQ